MTAGAWAAGVLLATVATPAAGAGHKAARSPICESGNVGLGSSFMGNPFCRGSLRTWNEACMSGRWQAHDGAAALPAQRMCVLHVLRRLMRKIRDMEFSSMATEANGTDSSRLHQTFPVLSDTEIARIARFGSVQQFARGTRLFTAGETAPGMFVLLKGIVTVTQRDGLGHVVPVVRQGPGSSWPKSASSAAAPRWSTATPTKTWKRCSSRPRNCAPCWWPRPTWASASRAR
jgi:hypothetical protein